MAKPSAPVLLIDARHVLPVVDGLGRYVLELLNGLSEEGNCNVIVLHTNEFPLSSIRNPSYFRFFELKVRGGSPKQHFILPRIIRKLKPDLYYYPFIDPPLFSPAPVNVFAVHDLNHFFFSRYAATESKISILSAKLFIHLSSLFYNKVIVFSEFVKQQLNEHVPFSRNKTEVIYHGYIPFPVDEAVDITHDNEIGGKYLLYVGNNRPHKNLERLFDAFQIFSETNKEVNLVVAGNQIDRYFDVKNEIVKRGLTNRIIQIVRPSNKKLTLLYRHALAIVYPSVSEGFGFPLLEAWGLEVPIVSSDATCLKEVAGDAAAFFDPFDTDAIAEAMLSVVNDESYRKTLINRGRARLSLFTWKKSAAHHLRVFTSLMRQ